MYHKSNNQSHIMNSRTVVLNFTVKKITFVPQCRLSQELRCAASYVLRAVAAGACSQLATRPTTSRPRLAAGCPPRRRPGAAPLRRAPWALAASACLPVAAQVACSLPAATVQEPRSRRPRPATRTNRKPPLGSRRVEMGKKVGASASCVGRLAKSNGSLKGYGQDVPDSR
jgi:hypothetical protein